MYLEEHISLCLILPLPSQQLRGHTYSSDRAHYGLAQEQNTFHPIHFFCLSPTPRVQPAPLNRETHTGFINQNGICPFSCVVSANENVPVSREIKSKSGSSFTHRCLRTHQNHRDSRAPRHTASARTHR